MKRAVLIALILLSAPAFAQTGSETVSQWAQQAVPTVLAMTPQTFDAQKESNRALFTKKGHESFYKAMEMSRIRESLEANGQTAKVRKMCVNKITPPDAKNKLWIVESEILYEFSNGTKTRTDLQKLTTLIEDSGKDGASKLAIAQYIAVSGDTYTTQCKDDKPVDANAAQREDIKAQIRKLESELRALGEDTGSAKYQMDMMR